MTTKKRSKLPKLTYFYFDGDLHKKIRINRAADIVIAWSYPKGQAVQLQYSNVRKNGEKAFTTKEVAAMVNRHRDVLANAIYDGNIPAPQKSYGLDANRNEYGYYWSEKDIMNLHEFLLTVHRGRPRKDGLVIPAATPSRAELRALIRQSTVVLHVQAEDGTFIPTWQAERF